MFGLIRGVSSFLSSGRRADTKNSDLEVVAIFERRKQKLHAIINAVQGRAIRFAYHINHATTTAQLDLVQADLYSVLSKDRGETYAKEVFNGTAEPKLSGLAPL